MKILSLILWVSQFGLSVLFPFCLFLYLGYLVQNRFDLGLWVMLLFGVIGFMTSISTAKSCVRSLLKEIARQSDSKEPPIAFNDHS